MRPRSLSMFLLVVAGCGDTGQALVDYPLRASGAGGAFDAGAWRVTLDVARVGIGPIYFCATETASMDLCGTAVNEFAGVAAFDALRPEAQELGRIVGVTGGIRSVTFDYAITWFNRQAAPVPSPAAPGGHSAHFEGRAEQPGRSLRFVADVDIVPQFAGTLAVQGTRVQTTEVRDSRIQLDLQVEPRAWFQQVDFDELAAVAGDPVVVPMASRSHNALVIAMAALHPPEFRWSSTNP